MTHNDTQINLTAFVAHTKRKRVSVKKADKNLIIILDSFRPLSLLLWPPLSVFIIQVKFTIWSCDSVCYPALLCLSFEVLFSFHIYYKATNLNYSVCDHCLRFFCCLLCAAFPVVAMNTLERIHLLRLLYFLSLPYLYAHTQIDTLKPVTHATNRLSGVLHLLS